MNYIIMASTGEELYHYGILGQRWGIRRYQNPDGTLTEAGKKHYKTADPRKIRRELTKEVRIARDNQRNYAIGKKSKDAINEYDAKRKEIDLQFNKDSRVMELSKLRETLDQFSDSENIPYDGKKYSQEEFKKIINSLDSEIRNDYKTRLKNIGAVTVAGEPYSKEALENLSKINIAYLQDLGFNEIASKYINSKLINSSKVRIY